MTGFDIAVLIIVGLGAFGGLMRGFVHEVLALSGWVAAIVAIYFFHTPLTGFLLRYIDVPSAAAVLAFALLMLVPYAAMKMLAKWAGSASRASVLGPVDRVLGFGFGALKGLILVVLAFSIIVLGYDTIWGPEGRPGWMSEARSYSFVSAASDFLVESISERHAKMSGGAAE